MSHSTPKVAFITGATRRIGHAMALRLAREGYDLALHCSVRSQVDTQSLAQAVHRLGKRALVLPANLEDDRDVAALMPRAIDALGQIDLLINNASLFEADEAENFTADHFNKHMAVNLRAPCRLAQALASQHELKAGAIINIIDQRVWRLNPRYFTYTLSKSAFWAATQTMAQAFAPRIRVNAIGPGPTLANSRQSLQDFEHEASATPLQRSVGLEEICDAVSYLANAPSVTGQMIAVDSGQHLAWQTPDVV